MKQRVAEMEREAEKLRELQAAAENGQNTGELEGANASMGTEEEKAAADSRSVYVGNVCLHWLKIRLTLLMCSPFSKVDYGATPEEIQAHFQACGIINRVTILCDKFTGHPKGSAFHSSNAVELLTFNCQLRVC